MGLLTNHLSILVILTVLGSACSVAVIERPMTPMQELQHLLDLQDVESEPRYKPPAKPKVEKWPPGIWV